MKLTANESFLPLPTVQFAVVQVPLMGAGDGTSGPPATPLFCVQDALEDSAAVTVPVAVVGVSVPEAAPLMVQPSQVAEKDSENAPPPDTVAEPELVARQLAEPVTLLLSGTPAVSM